MKINAINTFLNFRNKITISPYQGGVGVGLSGVSAETIKNENDVFIKQEKAAGIATLSYDDKNIIDFINLKRNEDYSKWRFNLSVTVPDNFFELVDSNPEVRRTYDAMIDAMHYCAEPGMIFIDRVNAANPVPSLPYKSFSPCADMALIEGEMPSVSHINLASFCEDGKINFEKLEKAAADLTVELDGKTNEPKRTIAIGVCGYADLLSKMGLEYGSPEALNVLETTLETINYASKSKSTELAKERGAFKAFPQSIYKDEIRNAATTALSPFVGDASSSIEPLSLVSPEAYIRTVAAAQKHVDNGVSMTVNLANDATKEDIDKAVRLAAELKLKGITFFREGCLEERKC
ncbi:MAG: hypothetical protein LBJ74_00130 [Heliobacteriaceae bacterium]|jgi:ribonucleoside-diphosphate reductase alpha chain|nr:hypothetical protein [Heliobacteriaceae bacterium]